MGCGTKGTEQSESKVLREVRRKAHERKRAPVTEEEMRRSLRFEADMQCFKRKGRLVVKTAGKREFE